MSKLQCKHIIGLALVNAPVQNDIEKAGAAVGEHIW